MKVIAGSLLLVRVVGRHVIRDHDIAVHVRFRGGQTQSFRIAEVDRLLDDHTEDGVAEALNAGILSGTGQPFDAGIVPPTWHGVQLWP